MAAGTISFFGTRRVVLLPEVDSAAYSDKDLDELCATLASLENAVVVLGSVFEMERNKLKLGKRAQKSSPSVPRSFCRRAGQTQALRAEGHDDGPRQGAGHHPFRGYGDGPAGTLRRRPVPSRERGGQALRPLRLPDRDHGHGGRDGDCEPRGRRLRDDTDDHAKNATGACKKLQTLLRLQQEPSPSRRP
mgnify:CR=1 FL=1